MNKTIQEVASMTLGELIKYFRESKGYSQEQLAQMVGVSPASISNYESDKTVPDLLLLRQFIILLKIPTEYVFISEFRYVGFSLYRTGENIYIDENGLPVCFERTSISSDILDFYARSKWLCCCLEIDNKVYLVCDDCDVIADGMYLARAEGNEAFRLVEIKQKVFTDVVTGKKCENITQVAAKILGEITEYKINPSI